MNSVIDANGYRVNVGIIITNEFGQLLWCKRSNKDAWQFPQGGLQPEEGLEQAMYRELQEEVGLTAGQVAIITCSNRWLKYQIPNGLRQKKSNQKIVGQKQRWFLLKLLVPDSQIQLEPTATDRSATKEEQAEFERWSWVSFWYPLSQIVYFKQPVYQKVLAEFAAPLWRNLSGRCNRLV